jgi:hypothetical protein
VSRHRAFIAVPIGSFWLVGRFRWFRRVPNLLFFGLSLLKSPFLWRQLMLRPMMHTPLADAGKWIEAALPGFLAMCNKNQNEAVQNSLDNDPLFVAVKAFVAQRHGLWTDTAAALFAEVTPRRKVFNGGSEPAPPKGWPANPRALRGALVRKASAFRVAGIEVSFLPRSNGERKIKLSRTATGASGLRLVVP